MGVFDKMLDVMKLNDDDDEYYDEEYDELEDEQTTRRGFFARGRKTGTDDLPIEQEIAVSQPTVKTIPKNTTPPSKITPIRSKKTTSMEVVIIKPQNFEDSREISETLLANRTVVLNMEGLDMALAQRIIDFISGSCYAINGNLQRVSNYIFVVTPHSVDISGDMQGLMDAFDFSGVQTSI